MLQNSNMTFHCSSNPKNWKITAMEDSIQNHKFIKKFRSIFTFAMYIKMQHELEKNTNPPTFTPQFSINNGNYMVSEMCSQCQHVWICFNILEKWKAIIFTQDLDKVTSEWPRTKQPCKKHSVVQNTLNSYQLIAMNENTSLACMHARTHALYLPLHLIFHWGRRTVTSRA
jgi:hypothetical protein